MSGIGSNNGTMRVTWLQEIAKKENKQIYGQFFARARISIAHKVAQATIFYFLSSMATSTFHSKMLYNCPCSSSACKKFPPLNDERAGATKQRPSRQYRFYTTLHDSSMGSALAALRIFSTLLALNNFR